MLDEVQTRHSASSCRVLVIEAAWPEASMTENDPRREYIRQAIVHALCPPADWVRHALHAQL